MYQMYMTAQKKKCLICGTTKSLWSPPGEDCFPSYVYLCVGCAVALEVSRDNLAYLLANPLSLFCFKGF